MINQVKEKYEAGTAGISESAAEAAKQAGCAIKDTASGVAQKAAGAASGIADSARDVANKAGGAVRDAATTVAQKAADTGSFIGHKAEDATNAAGSELKSLAGAIRDKGPHDGMLGNANSAVASTLESCGRELEHGLSGIAEDLTNTVRRHPVPAVLIGIGLGFMLARVFSK